MTQLPVPPTPRPVGPGNDVYTLLAAVGAISLLLTLVYVGVRTYQLFGGLLPPPGG